MSETLEQIRQLISEGNVRISDHGYDELAADGMLATEVVSGVASAQVVEDYPSYGKGPSVLAPDVLHRVSEPAFYGHVVNRALPFSNWIGLTQPR